jgi:hypothetical protein
LPVPPLPGQPPYPGQDSPVHSDATQHIMGLAHVPAAPTPEPEEGTQLLSMTQVSELHWRDPQREPPESNPEATMVLNVLEPAPPPASVYATMPLSREQIRALRAGQASMPSPGFLREAEPSPAPAAPAASPVITGGTQRMTPAEIRALRLAALGGVPATPAAPSPAQDLERDVDRTQILTVDSDEEQTNSLSPEEIAALRRSFANRPPQPK